MKKFAAIIMALVMVFALAMNAGAVEIPENTIGSYEETVAVGYDDYLIESIARGSNIPSANNVWSFSNGQYDGHVSRISSGVYTNYCFYPNSSGRLYVRTDLERHIDANSHWHDWKIAISIYDMSGGFVKETQVGELHTDSAFYEDEFCFSGLDRNTKYCFFIFVYNNVCQVSGDVIISNN